ncbi:MAG: hypothetical protein OQL28_11930 [Sedimenticola sp.]|nr:hypothetical protein [Sedimenticola sp.]
MKMIRSLAVAILVAALLTGCSAHPGAGNWQLKADSQSSVSRVTVHFEGRAELFDATSGAETHHCFWGGVSNSEIQLDCTTPEDTETRVRFKLRVTGPDQAQLLKEGRLIGEYQRVAE